MYTPSTGRGRRIVTLEARSEQLWPEPVPPEEVSNQTVSE